MILTVRDFNEMAMTAMPALVERLQKKTGRFGQEEACAWMSSLRRLAEWLDGAELGDFHIHLGEASGNVSLEYRLPSSSSWCDVVLLGQGARSPAAVVIELKNWDTAGDQPGPRPGLIRHKGNLLLHPSEQVGGYVEYCSLFHSAVQASSANVAGCTVFTQDTPIAAYLQSPHDELTRKYPVFGDTPDDAETHFPAFVREHLKRPDPDFATAFEAGQYTQDRGFIRNVASAIQKHPEFVLLDGQRLGFERCVDTVNGILDAGDGHKAVILVEGPPGSGKSVLAAQLWALLAHDDRVKDSTVFVSTSGSQKSNWQSLYERVSGKKSARGVVIPANQFNPGLSPTWVKDQRTKGHALPVEAWKDNVALYMRQKGKSRSADNMYSVAIVDEAHALIDPTAPNANGVSPSGWSMHAGPQAWHIIRSSRISIFLLDSEQSYRDNETTSPASLRRFAAELGAEVPPTISLAESQFRCAGSREYVEWVDRLLRGAPEPAPDELERRAPFPVHLVNDPGEIDTALGRHRAEGHSVRILAAYGREWKTKAETAPHGLPAARKDFQIGYVRDGVPHEWSRIWNYAPEQDYTLYVQAPEGSPMYDDPLAEVGCPYVVRGFDWDYVGLLWLSDLVWRKDRWVAQIEHVHESAWRKTTAAVKREAKTGIVGDAADQLVQRLARGYRILLTRAIRGAYVWCEDDETREHLRTCLAAWQARP